jgi:hypothetical protein
MSQKCRYCCKSLFAGGASNSPSRRRGDQIIMWVTTPPCAKLTGDSANGFETTLIGDRRSFRPLAKNQPQRLLGLLQHYLPTGDIARRKALLSHLEHVHGETIGVNLAIHVGPKAIHLIALDTFDGHQWPS